MQQNNTSTFQGAQDVCINGNPHFNTIGVVNNYNGSQGKGLDNLEKFTSVAALYDSSAQDPARICHPGTRETVLRKVQDWFDDISAKERIFWLRGPAGIGKSAIAQTIARLCRKRVAATFFFYRSDTDRNNGNRLFPTLAWQLLSSIPSTRVHVASAMEQSPLIPQMSIETQFDSLIASPIKAVAAEPIDHIIIIDGVDECIGEALQQRFLKLLGEAVANTQFRVRFLVCSRPEAHIQDTFDKFPTSIACLDLAEIDDGTRDIERYLRDEFGRIATERGLSSSWPSDDKIQYLVSRSSGQFVYASTVIKFVGDENESADSRLDVVMGLYPTSEGSPFADLDALYMEILKRQHDQTFVKDFLALMEYTNHQYDLAILLDVNRERLFRKLRGMRSVLKMETPIGVYHQSFLDFLASPTRSRQYNFSILNRSRRMMGVAATALVRLPFKAHKIEEFEHWGYIRRVSIAMFYLFFSIWLPVYELARLALPRKFFAVVLITVILHWRNIKERNISTPVCSSGSNSRLA